MKRLLPLLLVFATGFGLLLPATSYAQNKVLEVQVLIAEDDTAFTFVATPVDIDVLANDEETNTGFTKFLATIEDPPNHGVATIERNSTPTNPDDDFIRYTPATNFVGPDSLIYELGSSSGATRQATVRIFVNRAPTATDDMFVVEPDDPSLLDVLANDSDPDDDPLSIAGIDSAPMHGTVVILQGAPPVIQYNPDDGYVGPDSFDYILSDGKNGRDVATVSLIVDNPPVATDDEATTLPGTAVDISVLANDSDPDNDPLSVEAITDDPANGTATIIDGGARIRYTPDAGFTGEDSFDYRLTDDVGGTDEATVTVTVNTAPVAVDDDVSTPFETEITIDVLDNDSDADGDDLTLDAITDPPSHGTAQIVNQQVEYTPDDDFFGVDTFEYTISDDLGATASATVTVAVLADAFVQFVHNATGAGPVDIYINDARVADDVDFQEATPYVAVSAGTATVDLTAGAASDNTDPLFTTTLELAPDQAVGIFANGALGGNFDVAIQDEARRTPNDPDDVEFYLVNGVPDGPEGGFDLRILDPANNNLPSFVLANDLLFNEVEGYQRLEPAIYNIDVTGPNNATLFDVFQFDLRSLDGTSFAMVISGDVAGGTLTLLGFDAAGNPILPDVVTGTDGEAEVPAAFTLHGNFPNPFNPSTTLQFDLPAAARVHAEVVDVLGRRVLVTAPQAMDAGFRRTLALDGGRLASGAYFYRLIAVTATDTMVQTGRMTLVK